MLIKIFILISIYYQISDIRFKEEFDKRFIPNAINIPIDELRDRMSELDLNKNIYIYCLGGVRG